jgi:hypothetical protein
MTCPETLKNPTIKEYEKNKKKQKTKRHAETTNQ